MAAASSSTTVAGEGKADAKMAGGQNICDLIKADQALVKNQFGLFKSATTDRERQLILWKLMRELSMLAAVEEEIVYPMLKSKGAEQGKKWYDSCMEEHLQLKKVMYELDQVDCDPTNVKTMGYFNEVQRLCELHMAEETKNVLPFLSKICTTDELFTLGKNFISYKPYMPTRPHPSAPAGSRLGDRALAAADYLRDAKRFHGISDYQLHDPRKLPPVSAPSSVSAPVSTV